MFQPVALALAPLVNLRDSQRLNLLGNRHVGQRVNRPRVPVLNLRENRPE